MAQKSLNKYFKDIAKQDFVTVDKLLDLNLDGNHMARCSNAKMLKQPLRELDAEKGTQLLPESTFQYQQLQFSHKLHTTLDVDKLIKLYFEELAGQHNITGLLYFCPSDDIKLSLGTATEFSYGQRLFADKDFLGTLTICRKEAFTEANEKRIKQLTQTFVFSLRNALAFQRLKQTSQTDYLTGAGNRASLEASLDRELELAQRHSLALSLLILDIDHFKSINDQYGHPFGDKVLKSLVHELKTVARTSDTVFRFGGEEFVLILSNTNTYGAMVIAERIRKAVERLRLKSHKREEVSFTISVGTATLQNNEFAGALIQRADEQLYLAKANGRNQVCSDSNHLVMKSSTNGLITV